MSNRNPDWYSPSVNPIYLTVTRIKYPDQEGHATGFYYNSDGDTYLITNRHALLAENDGIESIISDSIRIFTRNKDSLGQRDFHDISLTDNKNDKWRGHPSGRSVDVVAIPVGFELDSINPRIGIEDNRPAETGSLAFDHNSILPDKSRVQGGDSAANCWLSRALC